MGDNINYEEILKQHMNVGDSNYTTIEDTKEAKTFSDMEYHDIDINMLPGHKFYRKGTRIKVKSATVKDVQYFSMIDDSGSLFSSADIFDKTNYILSSCVKVVYPDNKVGSYMDLFEIDRFFMIYVIREATFQNGKTLAHSVKCKCGKTINVELRPSNFRFYDEDKVLEKFYTNDGCYTIITKTNGVIKAAPPRISINKSFADYIQNIEDKDSLNLSFLKIIPFFLHDYNSITPQGIEEKLKEYEKMSMDEFQFKNQLANKMSKIGIEKAVAMCECGEEVHTTKTFPDRVSMFFIDDNAFESFIG